MKFTRSWLLLFDVLAVIAAFILSFAVRVPFRYLGDVLPMYLNLLLPFLILRIALFALFGLYRPIWANNALREFIAVLAAITTGSVVATMVIVLFTIREPIDIFPRLVLIYEWGLALALVSGMRYSLRVLDMRDLQPELEDEEQEYHKRVLREKIGEWLSDAPADVRRAWQLHDSLSLHRTLKRTFDIIAALFALMIFSPVFLIVSILIKLESEGPVIADTPRRAGRDGYEFRMYKFRGMVQNAHLLLVNNPELWEMYKRNNFKLMEDDPRLTRVGKFIRKTSIDELPNFLNVLHGEMSIVGPRPRYPFEIVAQVERFPETKVDVLKTMMVKPGVTGPWQIGGRSSLGYEERTRLDARYAEDSNLWMDIMICLKTIPSVLKSENAH